MTAEPVIEPPPAERPEEFAPVPRPRGNCPHCEGLGYHFYPARTNPRVAATSACMKCGGTGNLGG